jgi:ribosome-associated protein
MARKTQAKRKPARGAKRPSPRRPHPTRAAGPKRPRAGRAAGAVAAPARAEQPDTARPTAMAIARAALDKKAEGVTVLDVRGLSSYADYLVVATADSDRQASAIADHLDETMKKQGLAKVGVEGYETGHWILVDYGDVVAHVMSPETRQVYDLEGLWADAPRLAVEA